MAEKISTIVLSVNLDCPKCYKKVRKTLSKFKGEIQKGTFDEKQKKVTISGPFDPECLIKRFYCKVGCKIILDHEIKKPEPPKPPPEKETKQPKVQQAKPTSPSKPKPDPPPPAGAVVICVGPPGPTCGFQPTCDGRCSEGRRGYCCTDCRDGRRGYCCTDCSEGRRGYCCTDCRDGRRGYCCTDCSEGRRGCCCTDCCEGRPCTGSGFNSGCSFFSEEDPSSCRIM